MADKMFVTKAFRIFPSSSASLTVAPSLLKLRESLVNNNSLFEKSTTFAYVVKICDNNCTGLKKESWVLTDKELIVNGSNKHHLLGHLSDQDLKLVKALHNIAVINNNISRLSYD